MDFVLVKLSKYDIPWFKKTAQEAFQKGFEDRFGKTDMIILPEKDIDESLEAKGAAAYKAVADGEDAGGAIVNIDSESGVNRLDFLFVKRGIQGKGVGQAIWKEIERLYPETKVWETCTPYFDRRNIHFYVNVCGFCITEFFCEKHPMPDCPENFVGDGNEGMFGFRKQMK
ncbi:MAG TPA: GNAT family N-acetyltransferase [Ruminococcaceae bacterium]|nr:GNAT family N-acetyltransferase [Oscillospiraceae bacterium]